MKTMFYRSLMGAAVVVSLTGPGAHARQQVANPESELAAAVRATLAKGFTYTVRPVANIPDSMPKERQALAGTPVVGRFAKGLHFATDGIYEVYRKDGEIAVRTQRGWLPVEQFTSPLRQEVARAFDDDDGKRWKRGNVTAGRKALTQLIQIAHLCQRTNVDRLSKLGLAFLEVKASKDGQSTVFEGELTDATAFDLLQGPFAALVERGILSLRNVAGIGRVHVQDGLVKRIAFKATGFFTYIEENDNVQKRGACSLEVVVDLSKHGETKVTLPNEVEKLLQR